METKMKFSKIVRLQLRAMKELHSVCSPLYFVLAVRSLLKGLAPYVTVFFSARILMELSGLCRAEVLWKWVAAGVLTMGLTAALQAAASRWYEALESAAAGQKEILFCRKAFSMDYANLTDQTIRDKKIQLDQNDNWSGWGFNESIAVTQQITEALAGMAGGVTLTISLFTAQVPSTAGWLTILNAPLFMVLFFGILIFICVISGKMAEQKIAAYSRLSEEIRMSNQLFSVYGFIGMDKSKSVDLRMYDQQNIVNHYWKGCSSLIGADSALGRLFLGPVGLLSAFSQSSQAITTGVVYLYTCLKAMGGAFGIGSIAQYVGAVTALMGSFTLLLKGYGRMKVNAEHLENIFEYLDLPNEMSMGSLTTEKRSDINYEVEFKDVSFQYPGSEHWALRHVHLKFKSGQRLAVVGENGSGKTTFIKLLSRLYDPQEGQILLNGIDIRKYRYDDYMDLFSVVYQDFQLVSQPLGANVATNSVYDVNWVNKALADAGFDERLEKMDKGLETMLYKDLSKEGIEVSGGEAQKIAIARALYKNAAILILDEPTAALDPIAEAEIYSKFNGIAGDRTAIYISHRLSSCKFCDEIAVFDKGFIVQQGSHEDLVTNENGKYFELWNAQAQYYAK